MNYATDNTARIEYIRGPWLLAYILAETDDLYGGMLRRLADI